MALTNVLLVSQIAGYFVGLILSLCIMVPMSMHIHEFKGHCLLFSEGKWREEDGQLAVTWASMAYCNYVIVVGILMFVVCLVQIYRLSMLLYRERDTSFLAAFAEAAGCAALCALGVAAAVLVTLGFMSWCSVMVQRFPSCDVAAGQDIDKNDSISTNNFYMEMGTAQFGAWGAFATWVGLAVFATLKLCRYHQLENIRVSMYRERQRLVHESPGATPPAARRAPDSTPPAARRAPDSTPPAARRALAPTPPLGRRADELRSED